MDETDPTGFYSWWRVNERTDADLAADTVELDPRGRGICERTVRRVRCGQPCDPRGIKLLMKATRLRFEEFLPNSFLEGLE